MNVNSVVKLFLGATVHFIELKNLIFEVGFRA
jgi:hypothetical protein